MAPSWTPAATLVGAAAALAGGVRVGRRRPWRTALAGAAIVVLVQAALGVGLVVVPGRDAADAARAPPKVFGIGLSRTGTTSLASALHEAGYKTHHALHRLLRFDRVDVPGPGTHAWNAKLPRVDRYWADAFDATTDIHASLVFEQLARLYPDAKFVLTARDPREWARAARRFFVDGPVGVWAWRLSDALYDVGLMSLPADLVFRMMYGDYPALDASQWEAAYRAHDARVDAFFARPENAGRLLRLDVTRGEGWSRLAPFLGLDDARSPASRAGIRVPARHVQGGSDALPRAEVYSFSFTTQAWWELQDAGEWLSRWLGAADSRG